MAMSQQISIHILRVEDDIQSRPCRVMQRISIHILRVEDDPLQNSDKSATLCISIHILRVEDDVPESTYQAVR